MKNSIAIRLPNWVGDVMMAMPGLLFLKELGFEVHLLGKKWIADLFKQDLFHLHFLEKKARDNIKVIKKIPTDKMILLTNSFSSAFAARLAKKKTAGFSGNLRSAFLNLSFSKKPGLHESEYFWTLIRESGRKWFPDFPFPEPCPARYELSLDVEVMKMAQHILQDRNISRPFIMICPSATGTNKKGETKIWPFWSEFVNELISEDLTVVACPGPGEEDIFLNQFPNIILLENIKLNVYAALMQEADFIIANDSGPMHLAAAVNSNILGIFGATDPNRTSPLRGKFLGEEGQWPTEEAVFNALFRAN